MVDPRDGFLAHERFPTIAALTEWFEKQQPSFRVPLPEHRMLSAPPDPPMEPQEVRDAAVERWRRVKAGQVIASTAKSMLDWSRTQRPDTPENAAKLLETDLLREGESTDA